MNNSSQERDLLALDSVPFPIWFKNQRKKVIFCNVALRNHWILILKQVITDQISNADLETIRQTLDLTDLVLRKRTPQSQQQHTIIQGERRLVNSVENTLNEVGFRIF